jgi:cysteine desulfurase/selenocysteine lyase
MTLKTLKNVIDVEQIRSAFPLLQKKKDLIYFDSAATAQKPSVVIEAESNFYSEEYGTVHRAVYSLAQKSTELYHQARLKIQAFINAEKSEEIIFTSGTTDSINLVAYSFGKAFINPGDEILVSEIEHHANIVPWQILCEDRGAKLSVIPVNDAGEIDLEAYKSLLSKKTKLVAIAHVANSIGTCHPIKEMVALAHEHDAKVLVDGAQAVPHMLVNVQDLNADFYAFSGHKCYGPNGIGILYGKAELLNAMPPYQGGGDMIDLVSFEKTRYNELPLKFEAGTPKIAQVIALGVAIDFINDIGIMQIHEYENTLLDYATKRLLTIEGLKILGNSKKKAAIISFVIDGTHPLDVGTLLDFKGIAVRTGHHCAQPTMKRFNTTASIRVSLAMYNTIEEVDALVHALDLIVKQLNKHL